MNHGFKYESEPDSPVIRYVLAVILTVALVGLGVAALEYGSAVRAEGEVETTITKLDATAGELFETADPPVADEPPAQRRLTLTFPGDGPTSERADTLEFTRATEEPITHVTARIEGRATQQMRLDAPLQYENESQFDLAGYTGEQTVVLQLVEADSPVISITIE